MENMGIFKPKEENLIAKIEKVVARLAEITQQIEAKKKSVAEAHETYQARLAELAMADTEENQQGIANSKRAIGRLEDGLRDVEQMAAHLEAEKIKLTKESFRAFLRELPMALTTSLGNYNSLLDKALALLADLRAVHAELWASGGAIGAVLQKRAEISSTLAPEAVPPMPELEIGMGVLSKAPVPMRYTFQPVDNFRNFLGELIAYENKVESFQKFMAANPGWDKIVPAVSRASFGEVGMPGAFESKYK
jgi:hypothetical protein